MKSKHHLTIEQCKADHEFALNLGRQYASILEQLVAENKWLHSIREEMLAALKRALQIVGAMADGNSMIEHARASYEPEAVCREIHAAITNATGKDSHAT